MADPALHRQPIVDVRSLRGRWLAWRGMRRGRELDRLRTVTPAVESEALRRSNLVLIYGFGLALGLVHMVLATPEGPSFRLLQRVPGWPEVHGALMLLASALIAFGFHTSRRRVLYAGSALYSIWCAAMSLAFGANWWWWASHPQGGASIWWWVQHGEHAPSLAGFLAYGLIACGTALHSTALRTHFRRARLLAAERRGAL